MTNPLRNILIAIGTCLTAVSNNYANDYPLATDVATINALVAAYYEVISGPKGYTYNIARDQSLHAPQAIITRTDDDGLLERHDLSTEHVPLTATYSEGLFEVEIGRIVEQYGNIAHAWSSYEVRNTPDGPAISRGISSVSMYFDEGRWWIASWSTQPEGDQPIPAKYIGGED